MKKTKKIILTTLCLFLIAIGLTVACSAKDIKENDKFYINIKQAAVKNSNNPTGTKNNADFYQYELNKKKTKMRMFYISGDKNGNPIYDNKGKTNYAYCVRFGADINSKIIKKATAPENDKYFSLLSDTTKKGIYAAVNLGYPNSNLGVKFCDAYAATQIIIWEIQRGYRDPLNNKVTNTLYQKSTINGTPAKKAYDLLGEQIKNFYMQPSFANQNLKLEYNPKSEKYEGEFIDKNNVIENYEFVKSPNIEIKVNKNKILISSKDKIKENISLKRKNVPKNSQAALIANDGKSQEVLIGSPTISTNSTFSVESEKGFEVYKKGEKISDFEEIKETKTIKFNTYNIELSNVEFELLDSNKKVIRKEKTDDKGKIYFHNLTPGKYFLREVSSPKGYIKSEELKEINLGEEWQKVEILNKKTPFEILISKELEKNDNDYEGITFGLFTAEDIKIGDKILKKDSLIKSFNPDNEGKINTKINLPNGKYYIYEIKTKNGYKKSEEKFYFNFDDEKIEYKIKNEKIELEKIPDQETPKAFPNTGVDNSNNFVFLLIAISLLFFTNEFHYILKKQ